MNWWQITITIIVSLISIDAIYRNGIKAGIKHSLKVLNLSEAQIKKLNDELKSDKIVWST
jgi:ribosomal protein S13